jgi:hypothetical protein
VIKGILPLFTIQYSKFTVIASSIVANLRAKKKSPTGCRGCGLGHGALVMVDEAGVLGLVKAEVAGLVSLGNEIRRSLPARETANQRSAVAAGARHAGDAIEAVGGFDQQIGLLSDQRRTKTTLSVDQRLTGLSEKRCVVPDERFSGQFGSLPDASELRLCRLLISL